MQQTINCERFHHLDKETLSDFFYHFEESKDEIEDCLKSLEESSDVQALDVLYLSLQSLKGNFNLCYLDLMLETVGRIEAIIEAVRHEGQDYTPAYGDLITLAFEHVKAVIEHLLIDPNANKSFIDKINSTLDKIIHSTQSDRLEQIDDAATTLSAIDCVTYQEIAPIQRLRECQQVSEKLDDDEGIIPFLQQLAARLDDSFFHREGRTQEELVICLEINAIMGMPVPIDQLQAAVYAHDLGMAYVPHAILNKTEKLDIAEIGVIRDHVYVGEGILRYIPGFREAALIAHQHHEFHDGSGYPQGLKDEEIHIGAKMLAVADTFSSITRSRADRTFKQTLFKAVQEINEYANRKYDPAIVAIFNEVVKEQFVKKPLE